MPLRDYICLECGDQWEEFIQTKDDIPDACIHCDSGRIEILPGAPGGYKFATGSGPSSVTPKGSGSFKREKK